MAVVASLPRLDQIWFTRCPVPTATGLAYRLGWLTEEFARDGIGVATLQEAPAELRRHHYDHALESLIREGGNVLALPARAQGARTRLVGLTWIEESQAILVRPESGITAPEHLRGRRLAVPSYGDNPIEAHRRGTSIARAMSLHGYKGALKAAGLGFDDVALVEVPDKRPRRGGGDDGGIDLWPFEALVEGKVDAIYVKGASAVDSARAHGVSVAIDLDRLPSRALRVNNGTPRPITVHETLLERHFDVVVRFLAQTLRAAEWAKQNVGEVHKILSGETRASGAAVAEAYRGDFHESLHPDLSEDRLALFEAQKKFLWLHGFMDRDFDLDSWVDRRPLEAAWKLVRG
jgi:ABC-type nitrate/sulfonate/bicarbonate transport system substrate-binding protein